MRDGRGGRDRVGRQGGDGTKRAGAHAASSSAGGGEGWPGNGAIVDVAVACAARGSSACGVPGCAARAGSAVDADQQDGQERCGWLGAAGADGVVPGGEGQAAGDTCRRRVAGEPGVVGAAALRVGESDPRTVEELRAADKGDEGSCVRAERGGVGRQAAGAARDGAGVAGGLVELAAADSGAEPPGGAAGDGRSGLPAADDHGRRRQADGAGVPRGDRRSQSLPAFGRCRRLSGADAAALRIGRDRSHGPHLALWGRLDAQLSV